jgi:ribosomal protein S28E/S33
MRKYTQKALRELCRIGAAEDITNGKAEIKEPLERVGVSTGIYGINGGLLQGRETGRLYAIIARNAELFRHF